MPVIDRLPVPEALGQVPPRAPCPGAEEDPVDHHPVIRPAATPRRISGQKHPQTPPFLIRGVMTIQSIKHRTYLHHPACSSPWAPRPRWRATGCGTSWPPSSSTIWLHTAPRVDDPVPVVVTGGVLPSGTD